MNEHYAAVLVDLQVRKSKLEAELREIDVAIGGLKRLIGVERPAAFLVPYELMEAFNRLPGVNLALLESCSRFSYISMEWSVMWYLAEDVEGSAKTGEIASSLLAGGYRSQTERFPDLVSAVLSEMHAMGEVETSEDGGYRLTEQGRQTWESIRQPCKFRHAIFHESQPRAVQ
jgi:hypothetical protein